MLFRSKDSNVTMTVVTTDEFSGPAYYDLFDNKVIETEANTYIDFSERNPFGKP